MKKTVSVNIKGTNFQVEEDAYELLQDYIDRLTAALGTEEGSQEIIEDIELRIAEICTSKLNDSKTVIEFKDIEGILQTLGDPSDYVDNDGSESGYSESQSMGAQPSSGKAERRLFRDPDSALLGGVCSGFANYFGIDVVIMRVIFVALLFIGILVPLYIILWIIIPKAESTIDRLRMRGRPVTVETVKEEVDEAAERIRSGSKNFADRVRNDRNYNNRLNRGKSIFRTIIGIGFLGFGLIFLITFIVFFIEGFEFLPVKGDGGFMSITEYGELYLNSASDVSWMWIGGLTGAISGILILFSLGILLIFQLFNRWTKIALGILVITGITGGIICIVTGIKSGRDWATETETVDKISDIDAEQLVIIPKNGQLNGTSKTTTRNTRHIGYFGMEGDQLSKYSIDFEYKKSPDTLFHIIKLRRASGYSLKKAENRSKNIDYRLNISGDTIYMDTKYLFPKEDKLRGQRVGLIIEIPEGKSVQMDGRVIRLEDRLPHDEDQRSQRETGVIDSDGRYYHYNNN